MSFSVSFLEYVSQNDSSIKVSIESSQKEPLFSHSIVAGPLSCPSVFVDSGNAHLLIKSANGSLLATQEINCKLKSYQIRLRNNYGILKFKIIPEQNDESCEIESAPTPSLNDAPTTGSPIALLGFFTNREIKRNRRSRGEITFPDYNTVGNIPYANSPSKLNLFSKKYSLEIPTHQINENIAEYNHIATYNGQRVQNESTCKTNELQTRGQHFSPLSVAKKKNLCKIMDVNLACRDRVESNGLITKSPEAFGLMTKFNQEKKISNKYRYTANYIEQSPARNKTPVRNMKRNNLSYSRKAKTTRDHVINRDGLTRNRSSLERQKNQRDFNTQSYRVINRKTHSKGFEESPSFRYNKPINELNTPIIPKYCKSIDPNTYSKLYQLFSQPYYRETFVYCHNYSFSIDYTKHKLIGRGCFGSLSIAKRKGFSTESQSWAHIEGARICKSVQVDKGGITCAEALTEIKIMKRLDHPNVARIYEYYQEAGSLVLILEPILGEDLGDILSKKSPLSLKFISAVMTQLLRALAHCHESSIIHKDVKPRNIMVSYATPLTSQFANWTTNLYTRCSCCELPCNGLMICPSCKSDPALKSGIKVVLIDFGLSDIGPRCKRAAGTPAYMSPEIWRRDFGTPCDIFAAGVVLYQLITRELPFKGEKMGDIRQDILRKNEISMVLVQKKYSQVPEVSSLCSWMLQKTEKKRCTAIEALQTKWLYLVLPRYENSKIITVTKSAMSKLEWYIRCLIAANSNFKGNTVLDHVWVSTTHGNTVSTSSLKKAFNNAGVDLDTSAVFDPYSTGFVTYTAFLAGALNMQHRKNIQMAYLYTLLLCERIKICAYGKNDILDLKPHIITEKEVFSREPSGTVKRTIPISELILLFNLSSSDKNSLSSTLEYIENYKIKYFTSETFLKLFQYIKKSSIK